MKIEVNTQQSQRPFQLPCLMIAKHGDPNIVLMTERSTDLPNFLKGTVISNNPNDFYKLGHQSLWVQEEFKLFDVSITLSND